MEQFVTGIMAGAIGTLVMDSLNHIFYRTGLLTKIDMSMIGRMSAGWTQGHFFYSNPGEIKKVAHERLIGYLAHYIIGIVFAVIYVSGWTLLVGGTVSPLWALVYGIATTAGSIFFIFPSMGLGVLGRRSPEGIKSLFSSLANHLFFGFGMAIALAFV